MQSEYVTVVEASSLIWTGIPVVLHLAAVAAQSSVIGYALVHGIAALFGRAPDAGRLRRLGGFVPDGLSLRAWGAALLGIAGLLVLPFVVGASWFVSLVALVACLLGLLIAARGTQGRWVRRSIAGAAALALLFAAWEGDDPLAQTTRILFKANAWRSHELAWQLESDRRSPKVGDLAPDFELRDPSGEKAVRLSNFFGRRPVALVFGSYT